MLKLVKNKNIYLFEFISVYFGIFADSYTFYKFLNKYYLNLGYSSQQVQEIFKDFCDNLNNQINIKIFKAKNIYIYSFILNDVRYYEFRSNKLYKF